MELSEIMTECPVCLNTHESIRQALEKMKEHDIRHLPVTKDGQLVGMVSDRDLNFFIGLEQNEASTVDMRFSRLDEKIVKLMHTDVVSVDVKDEVSDVIRLMVDNKIGAVPVVESSSSKLVGIVSYIDILLAVEDLV